jgi:ParB-like chromosome segregation protein Spo0J
MSETPNTEQEGAAYAPHPCASLFPAMSPEEDADFLADIERNGLREPIIIDQHNRIVDGLHRYRACLRLGIKPTFDQRTLTDEEAWTLSFSLNFHRRHMSEATRAAVSAEARKSANLPVTQAEAAKAFNISERTQRSAEAVLDASPDLHRAVKNDQLSVHAAEQITKLPVPERDAAIEKVRHGDVRGARQMAKAARAEPITKSKDADKKSTKNAAAPDAKEAPAPKNAKPTASSASSSKKSSGTKQKGTFKGHAVYAGIFAELGQLPAYWDAHPLAPSDARHLAGELRAAADRIEHGIKE